MEIPPAHLRFSVANCTVGVGAIPISVTSNPDSNKLFITIPEMISPRDLPSLPTAILIFLPLCSFLQYSAKAETNFVIFEGVRLSPMIPLTPETDAIISDKFLKV